MCHSKWGHFFQSSLWGDTVVADHGFDSGNILQGNTSLNIPPLLVPRQFGDDELVETRRIASLFVHVEQAME